MHFNRYMVFVLFFMILMCGCSGSSGPTEPDDDGDGNGGGGGGGGGNGHAPEIVSISSPSGHPGDNIDITGVRFGDRQMDGAVYVGGNYAEVIDWNDIQITFTVPDTPDAKGVKVSQDGMMSNEVSFLVLKDDVDFQTFKSTGMTSSDMGPSETYGQFAAKTSSGEIYVAWCGYISKGVYFAKSVDGGKSFSSPVRIDKGNEQSSSRADSVAMAVINDGLIALVWRDYRLSLPDAGQLYLAISDDKGATFAETGMVTSGDTLIISDKPDVVLETSKVDVRIFWRDYKSGSPRVMTRGFNITQSKFDNESNVLFGAILGDNPVPSVVHDNNTNYVLWSKAGVYLVYGDTDSGFSAPARIDKSPDNDSVSGKPMATFSNGHLYFTYTDKRNGTLHDVFLGDYNSSSHETEKEVQISSAANVDFYTTDVESLPDGSAHVAIAGYVFDGLAFDTIIYSREYRNGQLRDLLKVGEFDETYETGSPSIVFDENNRPILLLDVRDFSGGAEIYIALAN